MRMQNVTVDLGVKALAAQHAVATDKAALKTAALTTGQRPHPDTQVHVVIGEAKTPGVCTLHFAFDKTKPKKSSFALPKRTMGRIVATDCHTTN